MKYQKFKNRIKPSDEAKETLEFLLQLVIIGAVGLLAAYFME